MYNNIKQKQNHKAPRETVTIKLDTDFHTLKQSLTFFAEKNNFLLSLKMHMHKYALFHYLDIPETIQSVGA